MSEPLHIGIIGGGPAGYVPLPLIRRPRPRLT